VLLERESELAAVEALVGAVAAGRGRVLCIEGAAGIGKSRLLGVVCERAEAAGVRVLAARASELEREFAFGVVRALFEPAVTAADEHRRRELLAGPARLAAPVVVLDDPDPRVTTGERLHALYWLTANLADAGPLLLVVDDGHWADGPSLRALAYLAHRLADLPVGIVVTARPEPGAGTAEYLAAVAAEPVTTVLRPEPLTRDGSDDLVRSRLPEATAEFCAACHEACGGNPLLLLALVDALVSAGTTPDAGGVPAVHERAPAILAMSVLPRLRRLPPAVAAVARAVTVLGPDAELRHAAALAGLGPDRAAEAADALVAAGLLAPGRPLGFAHPLLSQVVADHMSPAELHRGHLEAARRLAAEGAGPERVAGHLLVTERLGDPWVVEVLRKAAEAAIGKGAPSTAVAYLGRAMEEPPDPVAQVEMHIELGAALLDVSPPDGFRTLSAALGTAGSATVDARIALVTSRAARSVSDFRTAARFLSAVEDRLDELDPELRYEVEAERVFVRWMDLSRRSAMAERARALESDAPVQGMAGVNVLLTLAFDALEAGGSAADRAAELAARAAEVNDRLDAPSPGVVGAAVNVLLALDRVGAAQVVLDRAIDVARRRGSLLQIGEATTFRALTNHRLGLLVDAETDARLAFVTSAEVASPSARRWTVAGLVRCLVERGRLAEAEDVLGSSEAPTNLSVLLEARAHLRAAQGRPQEALSDMLAAGAKAERQLSHPGVIEWRPAAALLLHRLGRVDEAGALADEAVQLAQFYAAPRALGLALRAKGLVTDSILVLGHAVDVLAATPARLEHARTVVDLGAALRRANHRAEARRRLEAGMHAAHTCGAHALVARAREELLAAGARPRRPASSGVTALTPSERRVVQLAADGLGNREIAQALFVTTKTVETHLAAAYRKLGVTGRAELARVLSRVAPTTRAGGRADRGPPRDRGGGEPRTGCARPGPGGAG
jgi:DNA-binding CsgD family transcriptional regulator